MALRECSEEALESAFLLGGSDACWPLLLELPCTCEVDLYRAQARINDVSERVGPRQFFTVLRGAALDTFATGVFNLPRKPLETDDALRARLLEAFRKP